MGAQLYRIRDVHGRRTRLRRIRESSGRWCDAERQERLHLKTQVEQWIEQQKDPVIYRHGRRVGRLSQVRFSLLCTLKKVVLNCRISGTGLCARVMQATQDNFGTVAIRAELRGAIEIFEIRPATETPVLRPLQEIRRHFQETVENLIRKEFPAAQILKSMVSSDLEHSLSGKFVRVQFRSGGFDWLAIAAGQQEDQVTIDGMLSNGLLWRDLLRQRGLAGHSKLLLLAPWERILVLRSRLAWIRGAGRDLQLMALDLESETLSLIDLKDCGNLDTALTQVRRFSGGESFENDQRVRRVLDLAPEQITCSPSESGNGVVFRIRGLEFAHLRLGHRHGLTLGSRVPAAICTEADWGKLKDTVEEILAEQAISVRAGSSHYQPRPERWLESLLLRDIRVVDARLDPRFVYPQVPAFLGVDRGMIDILTVTREGRLAIVELKVSEDIELPMQGLDYWLRVRWHHSRNEFQARGYFSGVALNPLPPLLYFVCPQFRYHSSFPTLTGQIDPSVSIIQIGINENWGEGIRVVLRRDPPPPALGWTMPL